MSLSHPLFSIVTPVFNPPLEAFHECIESVLRQSFEDWEWCIVDDAADQSRLGGLLDDLVKRDARIRISLSGVNGGIVSASNSAASMATGQFLCLLDHDDMLHPTALEEVAAAINADEMVDYIYTDEDKIDATGIHYDVFLKPDWSPERLRGQNYCCHLSVIRRELFESVGGFRPGFDGSQDYDLILRVTEKARHVRHIPKVLYHWRAIEGSTAAAQSEKPYAFNAAQRAVEDHLGRVGMNAFVADAGFGYHRVVRRLTEIPLVSIVIPTRGDSKLIRGSARSLVLRCVDSILANRHHYENLEIVVVADNSTPGPVLSELGSRVATKVITYNKPFNFSDKCNVGFLNSSGEIIVLLNDDTEVITGTG